MNAHSVAEQCQASEDSLDFTEPAGKPVAPRRPRRARPKTPKTEDARNVLTPVLIVSALAAVLAFILWEPAPKLVVATRPSAQPAPAAQPTPRISKSLQAGAPAQTPAPPPAAVPKSAPAATLPAEFLKVYGEHSKKAGGRAIALALASDGRWAYGAVSGYAAQSDANDEALIECRLYKMQAGVPANCRLYAAGDNVVW